MPCRLVFITLFVLSSVFATAQKNKGKDWMSTITTNAINKPESTNGFLPAPAGFALYFTQVGNIKVPYLVYVPHSYHPSRPVSMVVFLHGAILARDSFQYKDPAIAQEPIFTIADTYNSIVVFPFGRSDLMWPRQPVAMENVLDIVKQVEQRYSIDKSRIFLGGISMGGISTFWFISNRPDMFAGFYAFSAMPRLTDGQVKFSNLTKNRPLYSMNAKDDPGFSYEEVRGIYEQRKKDAPGWHFGSVEKGGHRFIYEPGGTKYVKSLLGNLLKPRGA